MNYKKNISYLIGGLLFGIYNEFYFELMWNYCDRLRPFIWKDVPLVAPIGWALIITLLLNLSDYVKKHAAINQAIIDIIIIVPIFSITEFIMSRLKFWQYNSELHHNVFFMIIGYILASLFFTSLCRRFLK